MKTFPKPLTAEEEKYYLQRYKEGDEEAKQILVERNLRLVAHVAKKYQSPDEESDDLISIGTIGLIKAVMTFDYNKNNRLAAYAARCIDNAILSQMRLCFQTGFFFCLRDYGVQQCGLLLIGALQPSKRVENHIRVYIGLLFRQFTPAFLCFRIMDDHMEWSALSADITHLLCFDISVYDGKAVRYYQRFGF